MSKDYLKLFDNWRIFTSANSNFRGSGKVINRGDCFESNITGFGRWEGDDFLRNITIPFAAGNFGEIPVVGTDWYRVFFNTAFG